MQTDEDKKETLTPGMHKLLKQLAGDTSYYYQLLRGFNVPEDLAVIIVADFQRSMLGLWRKRDGT